jgi:dolichol-phosphate mannosyltransferase
MKMGRLASPLLFCIVGLSGMVVDLLGFHCLLTMHLPLWVARAMPIWLAMSWNYYLNRRLTFSHARGDRLWRQYCLYCAGCLTGAVANWALCVALTVTVGFFEFRPYFAVAAGVIGGSVLNYLFSLKVVFRSTRSRHKVELSLGPAA